MLSKWRKQSCNMEFSSEEGEAQTPSVADMTTSEKVTLC